MELQPPQLVIRRQENMIGVLEEEMTISESDESNNEITDGPIL
jgi:hypothetical protein